MITVPGKLTDSTGATASATAVANLADGTTYATDHGAIEANFATLTAAVNKLIECMRGVVVRLNEIGGNQQ